MKTKDKRQTKFYSLENVSLSFLLKQLKDAGYTENDYDEFKFKTDFSNVYYECDPSDIMIVYINK